MKQIKVTDAILAKLKAAAGDDIDPANLAVFAATAINTLPVRKKHPLYLGAVHPRSFLEQMAGDLARESRPLQIMHDTETLPIGRVFAGDVVDNPGHSELQVLFWVDKSVGQKYVDLVNNGTVDQVSVSVLAKKAISNKSGFDFFGPDASYENIWSGTDPDGNVMGKDGAHVILSDLDRWFEMSLVGQGGIQGAKILGNGDIKLAASGQQAPSLTLTLGSKDLETTNMDLSKLVEDLTSVKAEGLTKDAKITDLTSQVEALTAQLAAANEKVTSLEAAAAAAPSKEQLDAANASLKDVAQFVVAKTGVVDAKLPEAPEELVSFVKEKAANLSVNAGGKGLQADGGQGDQLPARVPSKAFRVR
jgi:outer membrane murein-binding lipoprotein Lpp